MSLGYALDDFIVDLQGLLRGAWGDTWGELIEQLPIRDNSEELPMPMIIAHLVSRRPSEPMRNIKPRPIASEVDPNRIGLIEVYEMWYDVDLEFRVYHNTHASAKELAVGLEEVLLAFAGYFKSRGLDEIIFREETDPDVESARRLPLPCRHLHYYLRIHKQFRIHSNVIQEIQGSVTMRDNPA